MSGQILCERKPGLAIVTLSAPARMNAMSRHMWRELAQLFVVLQADTDLRLVLLQGAHGQFCAGGDISEYSSFRFEEASLRHFHEVEVWGALQAMLDCDVPIVASIQGNCMGAGVELASCCDVRLASQDSRFGAPIAKLGFPMAPREAALVLREAGALTTRQFLLEAAVLDAPTLAQRGFLHHVVAPAEYDQALDQLLTRLLHLAPRASRMNKQTLRALQASSTGLEPPPALLEHAYRYAREAEHREGVQAFLDKRAPQFLASGQTTI